LSHRIGKDCLSPLNVTRCLFHCLTGTLYPLHCSCKVTGFAGDNLGLFCKTLGLFIYFFNGFGELLTLRIYDGPRNLDSVLSYTWEQKGGGPSGEFKEEAHAVI